jgi:hypothetical protein
MDNTPCITCNKRFLSHEITATCSLCKHKIHIKCLPNYDKDDIAYINNGTSNWSCPNCLKSIFPFYQIEDNVSLSRAFQNNSINDYDIETLQNMVYDPLESNVGDGVGVLEDIDPDENFLNEIRGKVIQNCNYYFSDTDIVDIQNKIDLIELSILHMNIRSIPKNFNKLQPVLQQSQVKYNLIALTETWLKDSNADTFGLNNYTHEFLTRTNKNGGGISLFLDNKYSYKAREDLSCVESSLEMLWVEIEKSSINATKNLIFGIIYRIPGTDPNYFNQKLTETLNKIDSEHKQCIHVGDYNLNLLNSANHIPTNEFADLNFSHSLYPVINKPTRITPNSASLIDNIFINSNDIPNNLSGILLNDISDHFPVFFIKFGKQQSNQDSYTTKRSHTKINKDNFTKAISEADWKPILENLDPQISYNLFHEKITSI